MDTTVRINIILILLLGFICGYIVKETIANEKKKAAAASYTGTRQRLSDKELQTKSMVNKVLSLGVAEEAEPSAPAPHEAPAFPVLTVPVSDGIATAKAPVEVVPEERLYRPRPDEKKKITFTKTKRGHWMAPPQGFFSALTNNYLIYREEMDINKDLQKYLEEIHGNFVLDVMPFSLFSKFDRILLMMFRTKDNYVNYTSMPQWSLASTDIDSQAIYIMENNAFRSNFVHELSHIYYDGFFKPLLSPLWLSEGFAVRMQTSVQSGDETAWLEREREGFMNGRYIKFDEFTNAKNLKSYETKDVVTWYAQSYSVVDYLLRNKSRDEFYQFSKNLKEGMPVGRALYRAYGMPFNNINALEYAWQADLQKNIGAKK
jgi:hypothetical protein